MPFKNNFITLFFFSFISFLNAQVGIGTNSPNASALLDISSSSKGFLPPRVALSSINDASTISSPATGLLVINTATAGTAPNNVFPGYYYFDGTKWQHIFNPSSNFIKKTILINSVSPSSTITGASTVSAWSASYTASGGTVEIKANLTAYSNTNFNASVIKILRDGTEVENVSFYFNSSGIHNTIPDLYAVIPNETGSHTYAIQISANTVVDANDVATITVTETKFN